MLCSIFEILVLAIFYWSHGRRICSARQKAKDRPQEENPSCCSQRFCKACTQPIGYQAPQRLGLGQNINSVCPGASSQGCCRYATLWMQPTRLALLGWDRNRREVSQQHAQRCHEIHQQPFARAFPCTQAAIGSWNQASCQIFLATSPLQSHWGKSSFQRRLGEDHCLAPSPWALCNTVWEIPQQVLGANGPRWHRSLENLLVQNEISPWVSRPPPAWCSILRGASHTNQCPWGLCANHRHWQGVGKEPFSFALELSTLQRQFQGHMFANLYRPSDAIRMTFALPEISGSCLCYFVKFYMCNYWGLLLCCCLGSYCLGLRQTCLYCRGWHHGLCVADLELELQLHAVWKMA